MKMMRQGVKALVGLLLLVGAGDVAHAARLKELADVEGFRPNSLTGMGIVVGLNGTGDDATSIATRRPLATLMRHLGVVIDQADIKAKNVALVAVTAELPPFARSGMALDVTVSSMGTAKSLQGGMLLVTHLVGADTQTYALAQGSLAVGGFIAEGGSGSSAKKNHVTVGRIPMGARVERDAPGGMPKDYVVLVLRQPDFTTASRIAQSVNKALETAGGPERARVRDPGAVAVPVAKNWQSRIVDFVASLEALEATPDSPGRVIIDERTGTIVVGGNVSIAAVAIAHGAIHVRVSERTTVSQPQALGKGSTVAAPESEIDVEEQKGQLSPLREAATVGDVAAALNLLGATPRDLVAVFEALRAAGALRAELQVQ
jgi:flagellar P-ring protein precursor FlgI